MKRGLGAACAIGAMLAIAPAALAVTQTTQTASFGTVSATFTFRGKFPKFSHQTLKIVRAGVVAYDQAVTDPACGKLCGPASTSAAHVSVQVLDLEGNGEPDVVLDLYSGGASCCLIDQVFSYDAGTMTYTATSRNFGDFGAALKDLNHDGRDEFVSADPSFKYTFTDGAASGEPIQIFDFAAGRFADVTRSYPARIAKDAARWLRAFKHNLRDGVGVLAAWAADEDLLGHSSQVNAYLRRELKAGKLRSAVGPNLGGEHFITHLRRFLEKHGYVK
jgi:hypothetical protein